MAQQFSAKIADWVRRVEGAAEAVFKESAQAVVAEAQRPGPSIASTKRSISAGDGLGRIKKDGSRGASKKAFGPISSAGQGGRLPVDTGFLRASLMASTSSMPTIVKTAVPAEGKSYSADDGKIEAVIAGAELGQTLYFGYTAAYARAMEYGSGNGPAYAFVRTAAQRWPAIVDQKAAAIKGRLGL